MAPVRPGDTTLKFSNLDHIRGTPGHAGRRAAHLLFRAWTVEPRLPAGNRCVSPI